MTNSNMQTPSGMEELTVVLLVLEAPEILLECRVGLPDEGGRFPRVERGIVPFPLDQVEG